MIAGWKVKLRLRLPRFNTATRQLFRNTALRRNAMKRRVRAFSRR